MQLEIISKRPSLNAKTNPTPLLFVHGAWHGAWCWDIHFLDFFARNGYEAHAVSLRGHGKSAGREGLRWARMAHYAEDVAYAARQLPAPPIVIGHSMGGFVVQKYLEKHSAPGAVLLASVPPSGALGVSLKLAMRHPVAFAKVNLLMSLWPLVASHSLAREAFFSESLPEELSQAYAKRLQDETYLGFLDMLLFDLPKPPKEKTPVLVLGGGRDRLFPPADATATARAYDAQVEIIADVAHDMMLEVRWQTVAERMLGWLNARQARST